ncbi:Biphenyl dioxygenase subunit beta [Streptomyces sp. RB17]|uniref:3-phenylpropionate/cinnamic acid dioxygenase subunit beta n=1 Tax=Streptomyces sp. RB17 TaxID=2585197 RepID=UPI00129803B6|nr:3-phenylpropionate/cinnamic acid dioxygenase subunit beta [Streptomyces sp. RB17]MQY33827.1 Biphenyl dioxygenase subunit beta [Streptomyces sp. RB17]
MDSTLSRVSADTALYAEVLDWIHTEAELLDDLREREWLETMVSRDVTYTVPLRQTVERARGRGFAEDTYHLLETYGSLSSRVARNETQYAWAEDPPSRIRHFVTNVRVRATEDPDTVKVRSNLLLHRTRQDQSVPQLLSGERVDLLRREDGRLMLLRRDVLLDLTVIRTHNLAIFF